LINAFLYRGHFFAVLCQLTDRRLYIITKAENLVEVLCSISVAIEVELMDALLIEGIAESAIKPSCADAGGQRRALANELSSAMPFAHAGDEHVGEDEQVRDPSARGDGRVFAAEADGACAADHSINVSISSIQPFRPAR
jgi:hypothetical protein